MMDAVEYLKTLRRMCNAECRECEYGKRRGFDPCMVWRNSHPEEAVSIAEKWAAEHPAKTRQSEFLKLFPYARVKKANGLPIVSPCDLDVKLAGKCEGIPCQECWKKFWLAEVDL
jgi:hypothetical protein